MDHDGFALHLEEEVVGGTRTMRTSVVFFLGIGDIGYFIVVEPEAEEHVLVSLGIDMILRDARISFGQL
eukprot:scaffold1057_cov187-Alexandrium_tamarense.AAC.1